MSSRQPVLAAAPADSSEHPHTPELTETRLVAPGIENIERHPLTLDHPRYGMVGGPVYLAYCETCPLANLNDLPLCACPPYGAVPASFKRQLAHARPSNYRPMAEWLQAAN